MSFDRSNFIKSNDLKDIDVVFDLVSNKLEKQKVIHSD